MGQKGDARRQQILDTAKSILIAAGPDGLVLRDIAERLGITHGNLQYYFRTKQELLVAIFDREIVKYTDSLHEAVSATTTRRGRLGAIIDAGLAEIRSPDTALWRMAISMSDHSPDMAGLLKKENDRYQTAVVKELKLISPELSPQRRRQIARIINAILDGLAIQFMHENPNAPEMRALESEIKAALVALVEAK
jgi:AcrR family transcriptional regulator